jgi:hypothetical protein
MTLPFRGCFLLKNATAPNGGADGAQRFEMGSLRVDAMTQLEANIQRAIPLTAPMLIAAAMTAAGCASLTAEQGHAGAPAEVRLHVPPPRVPVMPPFPARASTTRFMAT